MVSAHNLLNLWLDFIQIRFVGLYLGSSDLFGILLQMMSVFGHKVTKKCTMKASFKNFMFIYSKYFKEQNSSLSSVDGNWNVNQARGV